MAAAFAAKQMLGSTMRSARSTLDSVKQSLPSSTSTATAAAAVAATSTAPPRESSCGCLERAYFALADAVGATSPEEQRRRRFDRQVMPMLRDGAVFGLVAYARPEGAGFVGQMSRSVSSILGGGGGGGGGGGTIDGEGLKVMLALHEEDGIALDWRSMQLEQNKPKAQGRVELHKVQLVLRSGAAGIVLRDGHGAVLLSLEAGSEGERDAWAAALEEAMVALAPEIEETASESRGLLHRQQRLVEMEQRKRERERKKAAMGNVGMKNVAAAMMRKS